MIDKETAYAILRQEAHKIVNKGTPHVQEVGWENDEFFFSAIAAREAFNGDDRFLNDPGAPVTLIRKDDGAVVHIYPQDPEWRPLYQSMTPVDYLAA